MLMDIIGRSHGQNSALQLRVEGEAHFIWPMRITDIGQGRIHAPILGRCMIILFCRDTATRMPKTGFSFFTRGKKCDP